MTDQPELGIEVIRHGDAHRDERRRVDENRYIAFGVSIEDRFDIAAHRARQASGNNCDDLTMARERRDVPTGFHEVGIIEVARRFSQRRDAFELRFMRRLDSHENDLRERHHIGQLTEGKILRRSQMVVEILAGA